MKKITLPHNHEHAGVMYPAGVEFEVSEDVYKWIMDTVVAMRAGIHAQAQETEWTPEWAEKVLSHPKKKGSK